MYTALTWLLTLQWNTEENDRPYHWDQCEVSPVQQRRVEGRDGGDVEEQVGSVGGIADGIGEQIHL